MLEKFEAYQFSKVLYQKCKNLKVPRFLHEQLLRASSSIPLNLAEGSGKRTAADQKRFYSIAFGSLRECQAILEIENINDPEINSLINRLGAMQFTLSRPTPYKNSNQKLDRNRITKPQIAADHHPPSTTKKA